MTLRAELLYALMGSMAAGIVACGVADSEGNEDGGDNVTSSGSGATGSGADGPNMTPGTIACGTETCTTPDEKCCAGETPTCWPADEECAFDIMSTVPSVLACDDAADCAAGEICCVIDNGPNVTHECTSAGKCPGNEGCILDGTCSDGLECVEDETSLTGATCLGEGAAVTCGAVECADDAPVCCNDQNPVCVSTGSDCMHAYVCDSSSDCGPGYNCCGVDQGTSGSFCSGAPCESLTFCSMDVDCGGKSCITAVGLDVPAGFKVCQ